MEAWREELYHHGIKGQKWGIQNGPPYPLDWDDHTAAEKRQMKKDAKDIQKKLNKKEQEWVDARLERDYELSKATRVIQSKNKDTYNWSREELANALSDPTYKKASEWFNKAQSHTEEMRKAESATWKLIGEAAEKGYGVQSTLVALQATKGHGFLNSKGVSLANQWTVVTGDESAIKSKNGPLLRWSNEKIQNKINSNSSQKALIIDNTKKDSDKKN